MARQREYSLWDKGTPQDAGKGDRPRPTDIRKFRSSKLFNKGSLQPEYDRWTKENPDTDMTYGEWLSTTDPVITEIRANFRG